MRKILITGVRGDLGSRLLTRLKEKGYDVIGSTRQDADLLFPEAITSLFEIHRNIHTVIHCAGKTRREDIRQEKDFFLTNVEGTKNLFDGARIAGIKQFIFLSTLEVYSPETFLTKPHEESPRRPVTAYGKSKVEAEEYLLANAGSVPVVILRLAPVFSSDLLGDMLKRVLFPGDRFAYECLEKKRRFSFCSLSSLTEALNIFLESDLSVGQSSMVFNVADNEPYSQVQILELSGVKDKIWASLPVSVNFFRFLFGLLGRLFPSRRPNLNWICHKITGFTLMDTSKLQRVQLHTLLLK